MVNTWYDRRTISGIFKLYQIITQCLANENKACTFTVW
jgi:hypothetical protein